MALTSEQLKRRKDYLCSSDVASILGCGYVSAYDIWMEKVYDTEPLRATPAMVLGNVMEPFLIEAAKRVHDLDLVGDDDQLEFIKGRHMSHPDDITEDGKAVVEGKFSQSFLSKRSWRGEDEEGVPEFVWCQTQHQMYCCDAEEAYVPAMITVLDPPVGIFRVKRDDEAIREMIAVLDAWWSRFVETKTPPADVPCANMETVSRIVRKPETTTDLDCLHWVERWQKLNKKANRYKKVADRMKSRIGALMQNVEEGNFPDGSKLTYCQQAGQDRINKKALRDHLGDKYWDFAEESACRVLRFKG